MASLMNRLPCVLSACTTAFSLAALPAAHAAETQASLQDRLVGTWQYVAVDTVRADGTRVPLYGPEPQGLATFDRDGNYLLMTARRGLGRFASNDRMQGSADDYREVVQGTIAHFGKYTVNEADQTITFHIQTSTFPNWNGTDQKRPFRISGDQLSWRTPASSGGGTAEVVLRRPR